MPMPFEYQIEAGKAVITRCADGVEEATVPERIEDCDVVKIGDYAFANRTGLRSVTLPDTITVIGVGAFSGCTDLRSIRLPKRVEMRFFGHELFKGCTSLEEVSVPEGPNGLGKDMFSGCASLKRVVLPDSIRNYGGGVFRGCKALESITLPAGIGMFGETTTFVDSALTPHIAAITACMSSGEAFVFTGGQNKSPKAEVKPLTPEEEDALAPEYELGGFVLNNEKRLLRRQSHDAAKARHVFQDVLFGGKIEVIELNRMNKVAQSMNSDESLLNWLLLVDATIGLPKGRKPLGQPKVSNGMTYNSCESGDGRTATVVVSNGRALLVYGNIERLLDKLRPADPAKLPLTETPPAGKKSLLDKLKGLFG